MSHCNLPKALKKLCDTGCVYREKPFRHLQCKYTLKTDPCVAPCKRNEPCMCYRPPPPQALKTKIPCQFQRDPQLQ